MVKRGKTFIISGPTGVGKSTVLGALFQDRNDLYFSVLFHFVTEENPNPEGCKIAYENIQKAVRKLANK